MSLVNANLFHMNFTNTTFQKIPIPHLIIVLWNANFFTSTHFTSCCINQFQLTCLTQWVQNNFSFHFKKFLSLVVLTKELVYLYQSICTFKALTKQEGPNYSLRCSKNACTYFFSKLPPSSSCLFIRHFVFRKQLAEFFFSTKAKNNFKTKTCIFEHRINCYAPSCFVRALTTIKAFFYISTAICILSIYQPTSMQNKVKQSEDYQTIIGHLLDIHRTFIRHSLDIHQAVIMQS